MSVRSITPVPVRLPPPTIDADLPVQRKPPVEVPITLCRKYAGICVRITIVLVGFGCFSSSFVGYLDEYRDTVSATTGRLNSDEKYIRGYGTGYKEEFLNQLFFVATTICLGLSCCVVTVIIKYPDYAIARKRMNRLVHLVLAVFFLATWICGIFGTIRFTSRCCHIGDGLAVSTTYNDSPKGGFINRCKCTLYVNVKKEYVVGTTKAYNRTVNYIWRQEIYNQSESISSAFAHHFAWRCVFHTSGFIWILLYVVAIILV